MARKTPKQIKRVKEKRAAKKARQEHKAVRRSEKRATIKMRRVTRPPRARLHAVENCGNPGCAACRRRAAGAGAGLGQ